MPVEKRATNAFAGPAGVVVAARMARVGTEQGKTAHVGAAPASSALNDDLARGGVGERSWRMGP